MQLHLRRRYSDLGISNSENLRIETRMYPMSAEVLTPITENYEDDNENYDENEKYIIESFTNAIRILTDVNEIEERLKKFKYNELVRARVLESCYKLKNQDVENKFRYIVSALKNLYNYSWEKCKPAFCGVCMDPYENGCVILLNECKHVFCQKCIQKICKDTEQVKCPKCRIISHYETIYL